MAKKQIKVLLEPETIAALDCAAALPGATRSKIVGDALSTYFDPARRDLAEAAFIRRLDRFERTLGRFERAQLVLLEAFALYLRHFFFHAQEVAPAARKAIEARAKGRLAGFIDELGGAIASDKSFTRYLLDEFEAREGDFLSPEEAEAVSRLRASEGDDGQWGGSD